jgi:hypothetical protein
MIVINGHGRWYCNNPSGRAAPISLLEMEMSAGEDGK